MDKDTDRLVKALELDKAGSWNEAHRIVQQLASPMACWVHAYLHRKEGDQNNANYWYRRAGQDNPKTDLNKEWQKLYDTITTSS